ncbi:MAG: ABC transporter substrate-binding protein [Elusimicrobiota bacterium]|nr:ABC transporter substrate-binding protein [Elusimicrobiota bacterium]
MTRLALAVLLAVSCGLNARASSDGKSTESSVLDYALASDVDTLDPHWGYDAVSLFVVDQVYETLIDFKGESLDAFEPRLATVVPSLENGFLSKDGLTYAFPLRLGAKFHDGSTLSSADVKYSLMRFLLLDREGGPSNLLLYALVGVRSASELPPEQIFDLADKAISTEGGSVVLRLQKPFAPLMGILANFAHIVSKGHVTANGGWDGRKDTWFRHRNPAKEKSALYARANGTGPFRLESWDRAGKRIVLLRNEAYWRKPASLARVNLIALSNSLDRRKRLAEGLIDAAFVERRYLDQFQGLPGVVVTDGLPALEAQNSVLLNQRIETRENPWIGSGKLGDGVPPDFFADVEVRKAFAFAFDYDAFIIEGYRSKAIQARGPIPAVLFGYNERQKPWPFSPYQAEGAFMRARNGEVWARGFSLSVAYTEGNSERRIACRLLKEGVEKINPKFRVECRALPESRLLDEFRARRLPAFVYRWILDYPDPHNAVEPYLHSRGYFASLLGYANPRADAMIDAGAAEIDPAKRKALYRELQALAIFNAPAIFTADSYNIVVRRDKVQGWLYHPIQPYGTLYEVTKIP